MDNEKQRREKMLKLSQAMGKAGFGVLMLFLAAVGKDSWEYYVSSDRRALVGIITILGLAAIVLGFLDWINAITMKWNEENSGADTDQKKEKEERIDWIEGEIVDKEWNPDNHQVEWIVLRQKNGLTVRLWHYIADDKVYKVGDSGLARAKDRLITEFVSGEYVK